MNVVIREAQPTDAEQVIAYVQRLAEEPDIYIVLSPGEFNLSLEEEKQFIADLAASINSTFLVAEVGDQIIATLICQGGHRRAMRHAAIMSISVAKEWRGQGIGGRLMEHIIAWAKKSGIVTRIELVVFVKNESAIRLYEKYGFEIEGKLHKAVFKNGKYYDNFIMALLL